MITHQTPPSSFSFEKKTATEHRTMNLTKRDHNKKGSGGRGGQRGREVGNKRFGIIQEENFEGMVERSQGNVHVVVASEGPVAVGAFARSRSESLLDAVLAEDVTAGFDDRVFEVATANGAQGKCLELFLVRWAAKKG